MESVIAELPAEVRESDPEFDVLAEDIDLLAQLPVATRLRLYRKAAAALADHSQMSHKPEVRLRKDGNENLWLYLRLNPFQRPMLVGIKPLSAKDTFIFPESEEICPVQISIASPEQSRLVDSATHELASSIRLFRQAAWDNDVEQVEEYSRRLTDTMAGIRRKCIDNARTDDFVQNFGVGNR